MIDEQKQRGYMLKLPPELPVEMYGWLYDGLFIFTVEVAENAWVDASNHRSKSLRLPDLGSIALLRTCQTVHTEANPHLPQKF